MSYGLRGYRGGLRGLGDNTVGQVSPDGLYAWDGTHWQPVGGSTAGATPIYVAPPQAVYIDPGVENDPRIVAQNVAAAVAQQDAILAAQAAYNYQQCLNNGTGAAVCASRYPGVAPSGNVAGTYIAPPYIAPAYTVPVQTATAPAGIRAGSLSFVTSRGGSGATVYPGDTWSISITGASPNTPVSVLGGKDGAQTPTVMGATDSAGNFSRSGTFQAADIGAWSERWSVGGAVSGTFTFTIVPTPATAAPPPGASGVAPNGTVPTVQGAPSAGGAVSANLLNIGGFDLSSIPWWGWVAAAGGLFFVTRGKH